MSLCPGSSADAPPQSYRIVFECQDEISWDLCIMDPNGSNREFLLRSPDTEAVPIVSPDHRWIAYSSGGSYDILVVNVDGSGKRNLTNTPGYDVFLSWSPDSRYILMGMDHKSLPGTPFVDIETGDIYALKFDAFEANWSPDGRRLACQADINSEPGLYVRNLDGSGLTKIVADSAVPGTPQWPKWSPDGQHIAFTVGLPDFKSSLYVVGADGNGLTLVSGTQLEVYDPIWSPDSKCLIFVCDERIGENGYDSDIYVVNFDGTGLRQITNAPGIDAQPAWSPDGQQIAFASRRDGPFQIYVMNSDGNEQTRLTHTTEHEQFPCWVVDTRPAQSASSGWSDGQAHLTGQIVDAGAGSPIEGALVVLGSHFETKTTGSGEFTMQVWPAGQYILRVMKDGYQPYQVDQLMIPPNSTVNLKISLVRGGAG